MKTFIIAEAGSNHNRNLKQAFKLCDVAKETGCDAVKFQTYSSETLYCKNTPDFAGYKNINKLIKDIELPREWQKEIQLHCDKIGIEFMSSPFDETAVEELIELGVKRLKIAGFESTDFRFVEMVAKSKLPLIISLGIGFKVNYIGKIFEICNKYGNDLTLLHCNNAYPTPMEDINLYKIRGLKHLNYPNLKAGLSDHTMSTLTPALAVTLGATVIEKHFTLSRHLPGPDHPFALEPTELKEMVDYIRLAEKSIIKNNNEYTNSELDFVKARRSIVSKTKIKKGDILTESNITTKRPYLEGCISASDWELVLGKIANVDIEINELIKKNHVI
jgi:sialic acid synthase SpsE